MLFHRMRGNPEVIHPTDPVWTARQTCHSSSLSGRTGTWSSVAPDVRVLLGRASWRGPELLERIDAELPYGDDVIGQIAEFPEANGSALSTFQVRVVLESERHPDGEVGGLIEEYIRLPTESTSSAAIKVLHGQSRHGGMRWASTRGSPSCWPQE